MSDTPLADLVPRRFGSLQLRMALVWCSTILGVAVVARASDNFAYQPIVLTVGFSLSWAVIEASARRFRTELADIEPAAGSAALEPEAITAPATSDRSLGRHS